MRKNPDVEVDCVVRRETEKALLIDFGAEDPVWIPKSQIKDQCEESDGTITSIFIPEWLAIEKGIT